MRRDDREDPFGDIFDEIERMMQGMTGGMDDAGFGSETHIDVYEEDDLVRLVADLPGIDKDELSLQCDGKTLTINNGVLNVTFDRADDTAAINVE